jgi:arabinan endo-1,5-alpha-L-arabinosidase
MALNILFFMVHIAINFIWEENMGYKQVYKKRFGAAALAIAMTVGLAGCGSAADQSQTDDTQTEEETATTTEYKFKMTMDGIATGDVSSGVSVHDPSIIKDGDTYYIFGSHMTAAKCDDLLSWESIADGYTTTNPVYGQIYDVKEEAFAYAGDRLVSSRRTTTARMCGRRT